MLHVTSVRVLAIALFASAFWGSPPAAAQSHETFEITHHPRPGDHWRLKSDSKKRLEAWVRNGPQDPVLAYTKSESSEVEAQINIGLVDPAGNHARELKLTRLKSELAEYKPTSGRTVVSFDSDQLDSPDLPEELRRELAGIRSFRYEATVGPEGQVLSYRAEPEGSVLAQSYTAMAAKAIQQDYAEFTKGRLKLGESWSIGRRKADGSLGGSKLATVEYDLTGRLVQVGYQDGARHALIQIESSNPSLQSGVDANVLSQTGFTFEMLAEYDFAKGRIVMVSLTTVVKGSARNPQNAETAEITVTTVVQEVDLDTPSWMVAQAIKAKETLKGAMLVTPMQPDVLP